MRSNLIQFRGSSGETCIGVVRDAQRIEVLAWHEGLYGLAREAVMRRRKIADLVADLGTESFLDYDQLEQDKQLLAPVTHPEPARMLISGTGLTHLGSADTRAAMHAKLAAGEANLTDSMRIFRMGLEGGKPAEGTAGVQPEWFYKGDGSIVVPPGGSVESPDFALDLGDEVEVAGVYIIGDDGRPYRIGFVLGNEYSDHKTEKINYLYLAHSKLRPCSFGPELVLGELPAAVTGFSSIIRDGEVVWQKPFASGEDNMTHTIANLEYHHFKYRSFLRPGDIHVHFFGTGTLSFGDGFESQEGDIFEIRSDLFGRPLRNTATKATPCFAPGAKVQAL